MRYFIKSTVDLETLNEYYFQRDGNKMVRGKSMGWGHYVDMETREIKWLDPEYVKEKEGYKKAGGLKSFFQDLIDLGIVRKDLK